MTRAEIVLAAMAAGGRGMSYDGLRMQKLLFLIDAEIPELVEGPHFEFAAYNYGPFDKNVYAVLRDLDRRGQVRGGRWLCCKWAGPVAGRQQQCCEDERQVSHHWAALPDVPLHGYRMRNSMMRFAPRPDGGRLIQRTSSTLASSWNFRPSSTWQTL